MRFVSALAGFLVPLARRSVQALLPALALAGAAQAADLGFADYQVNPTEVAQGASATFTASFVNDGPPRTATVTFAIASGVEVVTAPSGCTLAGSVGSQTLTCTLTVADLGTFSYQAIGRTVGVSSSTASITAAGNVDGNSANNTASATVTVRQAADFTLSLAPSVASIPAGGVFSYTATVRTLAGSGSVAAGQGQFVINLPPTNEFTYQSATSPGSVWSCTRAGAVLTCSWVGSSQPAGVFPAVTITGRVIRSTAGTITANGSVSALSPLLDPVTTNNAASNVIVTVEPGTDLRAVVFIASDVVLGGPPVAAPVNIRLTLVNDGPQAAASGATIATTVPPSLTIGTLPSGCSRAGATVTCTAGSLAVGAQAVFRIPVIGASLVTGQTLTATLTPPAGLADGNASNDSATTTYNVVTPTSDLTVSKTKGPNPVQVGGLMTSTITLRNVGLANAAYSPSNPLIVTDEVGAFEELDTAATDAANAGAWTCVQQTSPTLRIVCTSTGTGSIAAPVVDPASPGGTLGLVIRTTVLSGADAVLNNTACVGSTAGSQHTPADTNTANDCAAAGVRATPDTGDLALVKDLSTDQSSWFGTSTGTRVPVGVTDASYFIRLRVTNTSTTLARTVNVRDEVSPLRNGPVIGGASWTPTVVSVVGTITQGSCTITAGNPVFTCSLTDLAPSETREIVVQVDRALTSGNFQSEAQVSSPDFVDTNGANNVSTAYGSVAAIADVRVNAISMNPGTIRDGVATTVTVSVQNVGANPAAAVTLAVPIDQTRFDIVPGSASTTKSGASCTLTATAFNCALGTYNPSEVFQASFQVVPRFTGTSPTGFSLSATTATTTPEDTTANNTGTATPTLVPASVDLRTVVDQPVNTSTDKFDPLAYAADVLLFDMNIQNNGPSRATDVSAVLTVTPPAGHSATLQGFDINPANARTPGNTAAPLGTCSQTAANTYTCRIDPTAGEGQLAVGQSTVFRLRFTTGGPAISLPISYTASGTVRSAETDAGLEISTANNTDGEPATLRPRVDFAVEKRTVTAAPVNINQDITFEVDVWNDFSGATAAAVVVSDTLPADMVVVSVSAAALGGASLDPASTGTLSSPTCSGIGTGSFSCTLTGALPGGTANRARLTVVARAPYGSAGDPGFTGPYGTALVNTAIVAARIVGGEPEYFERDPQLPNTATSNVTVREAAIAGVVFNDANRNGSQDAGEGLDAVRLTITGTDIYGNAITKTFDSFGGGTWRFGNLPPGTYTVTETQPTGYFDREETAGTFSGSAAPGTEAAFGNSPAQNRFTNIVVGAGFEGTGYRFREVQEARARGFIYRDLNRNGDREAGETGFAPAAFATSTGQMRLEGLDLDGNAVARTATVDGAGAFDFPGLLPSGPAGYTLVQLQEPTGTFDGLEQNGDGLGPVLAGSADRPLASERIALGQVNPGADLTERNFGEVPTAQLSGFVWLDPDQDAVRQGSETQPVPGVQVRLTGTTDVGGSVDCTVTANGQGAFQFPDPAASNPDCRRLRAGSYGLSLVTLPGFDQTGVVLGSFGGTAGGATAPGQSAPGASTVSAITIGAAQTGSGYGFGLRGGRMLAGRVYLDLNRNGSADAGEPGLAGVNLTLSGTAITGQSVCVLTGCSATTASDGSYVFTGVPASNWAGYTVTEQSQTTGVLADYADGAERLGEVNGAAMGTVGPDRFAGIVFATNSDLGTGYDFGEWPGALTAEVYLDRDRNGGQSQGDTPQVGQTVTLSGQTRSGQNVCAVLASLNPAQSCAASTGTDGRVTYPVLPAADGAGYRLVVSQPAGFADGAEQPGTAGGTATDNSIAAIALAPGLQASGYQFGDVPARIEGVSYVDANANGVRDGAETGLAGVTFTLTGTDVVGAVSVTTVTDTTGAFRFDGLRAGNYTLVQTQPAGYADGDEQAGIAGGTLPTSQSLDAAGNTVAGLTLAAGQLAPGYLFGDAPNGGIDTVVFLDRDRNGVQDPGEPGLPGVTVRVLRDDGTLVTTLVSGPDGRVGVGGLLAGTYRLEQVQPNGYASAPGDQRTVTVGVGATVTAQFPEWLGSLSARVYADADGSLSFTGGERGLLGVSVRLTGIDVTGAAVDRTVQTDTDGVARFVDLLAGSYALTQTQPAGFVDGAETLGDAGGAAIANDAFTTISMAAGQNGQGYLFGELLANASVGGSVWRDLDHDRVRGPGEPPISGWTVILLRNGTEIARTATASDGSYRFTGLIPGPGYDIRFRHPQTGAEIGGARPNEQGVLPAQGVVSVANPAGARFSNGALEGLSLREGDTIVGQSLPLDPNGVVYDALTRLPVAGAAVTLTGPAGFDPTVHLLGGTANRVQTTAPDGFYQYFLLPGAPAGTYGLSVQAPVGYAQGQPSVILPPCAGPLVASASPSPLLVQAQADAPPVSAAIACSPLGAATTAHFLSIAITPGVSAEVVNNHIPVDPLVAGVLQVVKTTPRTIVERGELVPYTLTVRNTQSAPLAQVDVVDQPPAGFVYRTGSARVDGVPTEPLRAGRTLVFPGLSFAANQAREIELVLAIGAGVAEGDHTNRGFTRDGGNGVLSSNIAEATVRLVADALFDCTDVIGKVWDDRNGNGRQEQDERGLPGVRIATLTGELITTDAEGRYHIACALVPHAERGSNLAIKLDERTLPLGYRVITENPEVVRATRGRVIIANFGAAQLQVVRIDLDARALRRTEEGRAFSPAFADALNSLLPTMEARPSVLRVTYVQSPEESEQEAARQLNFLVGRIEALWAAEERRCRLIVEAERVLSPHGHTDPMPGEVR